MAKKPVFLSRLLSLLLSLSLVLSLFGCASSGALATATTTSDSSAETDSVVQAEQAAFSEFTARVFAEELTASTLNLHYMLQQPEDYGITDYEVTLGDYSLSAILESYEELAELLEELTAFDYELLTQDQQLVYDIFLDYLSVCLSGAPYYLYNEELSPTIGLQAELPILLAEYAFDTEQDIQEYLLLLAQLPELFAQLLALEQEKAAAGLFMSDIAVEDVIASCEAFLTDAEDHYLITTFEERVDSLLCLSEEEKAAYKKRNLELFEECILPAYQSLIDGLNELKGSGVNEYGLVYFPEGQAYYEYLVAFATGTQYSVAELEELIYEQLSSDLTQLYTLLALNPSLYQKLSSFSFSLTDPEEILTDLKNKISEDFPALTDTSYVIKYVPTALEEHLSPAFYLPSRLDDITSNSIYINAGYLDASSLYSTLAHEGYPGHLYQTIYAISHLRDPLLYLVTCSGYVEGWATYVEYYSYQLDEGNSQSLLKAASLNSSATLALYALADILIHYEGWTLEQIQEYLATYFGVSDIETASAFYYYIVENPVNYLTYYVGYLEILLLREEAEEALGERFSLLEFHTFLLDMGECSFRVIRSYFDLWLAKQLSEEE